MRYLLDGRPLQGPSAVRGIGTYASSLLAEYAAMGLAGDITLLLASGAPLPLPAEELGLRVAAKRLPITHHTLQPVVDPVLIARAVAAIRPDVYHGIELAQPLWSRAAVVISVHDLIPFVFPRDYPWVRRARVPALRLLRRADRVLVPSQATRDDVVTLARVAPARVEVTPLGVAAVFRPAAPRAISQLRTRLRLQRPYLLSVGTFDPRKRIHLLAEVATRVCAAEPVDLVVAGDQGTFAAAVEEELRRAGLSGRAHLVGHIPVEDLVSLYSGAACLVFTSAYEGFGLPTLEAMACGTSVALFDNSSLAEIAGPATVMSPDGDSAAMAAAIINLLRDPADRERRGRLGLEWAARFTWRATAQATLAAYQRAVQAKRRRPV